MKYDGHPQAILQTLCTRVEAMVLEAEMRLKGCTVEANCPDENAEQKAMRKNVMHLLGGDKTFPCEKCPGCAWFDPTINSLCGAGFSTMGDRQGWDDDAMKGVMASEKYTADFARCPIREGVLQ